MRCGLKVKVMGAATVSILVLTHRWDALKAGRLNADSDILPQLSAVTLTHATQTRQTRVGVARRRDARLTVCHCIVTNIDARIITWCSAESPVFITDLRSCFKPIKLKTKCNIRSLNLTEATTVQVIWWFVLCIGTDASVVHTFGSNCKTIILLHCRYSCIECCYLLNYF